MPRLIHLNGPSGVGKSTIAQRYVDRHHGVLNLDTDQVVSLIGGWRDNFWETLKPARLLAASMAETHLRSGHDVVMPQLATRLDEVADFEAVCARTGAEYREIVLTLDRQRALARFAARAASDDRAPHRYIDEIIAQSGGSVVLERIHDHMTAYLSDRPGCAVVPTDGHDIEKTYDAVTAMLTETA